MVASSSKFVTSPPRVTVMLSAPGSISSGTWGLVTWNASDGSDYEGMRQGSRVTIRAAGRYSIAAQVSLGASATGHCYLMVRKNSGGSATGGIAVVQQRIPAAASSQSSIINGAGEASALNVDDYLELFAWQNSGGALALNSGPGETVMSVRWVALD